MTRVGRCTCCTRFATVNVFPLPVTPSSACWRSPRFTPATSSSIARGWSPCGLYSLTSLNGMAHECNRRSSPALSRRFSMRQTIACTLAVFLVSSPGWSQTKAPAPTPADPKRPAQVSDAPAKPVVRLIATGGTIAMKIDPVKKAPVPAISGEDLIATVPEIAQVARIEVENLSNVPSAYMDPDRWVQLQRSVTQALARPEVAGVIVSHGTDTLEETAWFLDLTVESYGGADGTLLRAAVAAGSKGLVIQALGWGNVNVPMFQAIKEVIAKGIPVVISTRVWNGRVLPNYGFEGGGKTLQQAGAVFADNLSPQKARILLMLALQTTSDAKQLQQLFDR